MIRLAVRVRREQAELVLAELLELAPSGVEEVDAGEHVEFAVYGAAGELPSVPSLKAAAGDALVEISSSETSEDWARAWRSFHRPVLIEPLRDASRRATRVPALYVRPPWEPPARAGAEVADIAIDPGQAFGTGAHASTRLCLELLLEIASRGEERGALLDIGTGSGVLAIAAARLGFAPVLAIDHDPHSLAAAQANAAANGVEISVRRLDLRREAPPPRAPAGAGFRVVVANLLRPLLLDLSRSLARAPEQLVLGGLLGAQAEEVAGAFRASLGLAQVEPRRAGEWVALLLSAASAQPAERDSTAVCGTSVAARAIER